MVTFILFLLFIANVLENREQRVFFVFEDPWIASFIIGWAYFVGKLLIALELAPLWVCESLVSFGMLGVVTSIVTKYITYRYFKSKRIGYCSCCLPKRKRMALTLAFASFVVVLALRLVLYSKIGLLLTIAACSLSWIIQHVAIARYYTKIMRTIDHD